MKTPKPLTEPFRPNAGNYLLWIVAAVATIALLMAVWGLAIRSSDPAGSGYRDASLERVQSSGVLRVGYGSFPPYTTVDPNEADPNKQVKGFSVDVINEIASRATPPLKVEFYPFSWDSLKAEVETGKFDMIIDPVFQTVPRAMDFRLSRPYSYFGIAVAIVKKGDNRFRSFSDLDRPDITIALAEGWTSSEYARKQLTKPKFISIPVTGDAFNQLDEVRLGRADVALNDVPTVMQYAEAHSGTVEALWLDEPPSSVPGGFLVSRSSQELSQFLDDAIDILIADGTLQRIDQKWKALGAIPILTTRPGEGLNKTGRP